jgi:Flp pilus assembly protein TadD
MPSATRSARRSSAGNDPCPCGSGKRYKQCHGAVAATATGIAVSAAATAPPKADDLVRAGMTAHRRGDLGGAERQYAAALAADPAHPVALHYLGVIRYQRRRLGDALPLLERAVVLRPEEPEFHNNLGLALAAADRVGDAIAAYRQALARKPDHTNAWNNLGLALQADNALPDAIDAFRRAVAIVPDFAQAHWNLSLALLAHGEYAEGWREYEWRLSTTEFAGDFRPLAVPRWGGIAQPGRTLLLTSEQGLGDAIQFARFARPLAAVGMRVVVAAPRALVRLFATAPGVIGVVCSDDPAPACDAFLPLLSTAGALGIVPVAEPPDVPYLVADPARRAAIAAAWAPHQHLPKVGLVWAGNARHPNDLRAAPLAALAPLFDVAGVAWFSPQKGDAAGESERIPAARPMVPLPADNDLDDTAARIAELDLVISVDTSVAHLAGALGKPVWILLPYAPDWRWLLDRTDSPWYPTARLFRQPRRGDWDAVARDVAAALATLVAERRGTR